MGTVQIQGPCIVKVPRSYSNVMQYKYLYKPRTALSIWTGVVISCNGIGGQYIRIDDGIWSCAAKEHMQATG